MWVGLGNVLSQPNGVEPGKFVRDSSKATGTGRKQTRFWSQTNRRYIKHLRSCGSQGFFSNLQAVVARGYLGSQGLRSSLHSVTKPLTAGCVHPGGGGRGRNRLVNLMYMKAYRPPAAVALHLSSRVTSGKCLPFGSSVFWCAIVGQ